MLGEVDQVAVANAAEDGRQALLIGRRYERAKKSHGGQIPGMGQNDPSKPRTSATIAADHGVSEVTVRRNARDLDDNEEYWPSRAFSRMGLSNDSLRQAACHRQIRTLRPGEGGNCSKQNLYNAADVRRRWPHKWPAFSTECVKYRERNNDLVASGQFVR